jgi:hypothetical protein
MHLIHEYGLFAVAVLVFLISITAITEHLEWFN